MLGSMSDATNAHSGPAAARAHDALGVNLANLEFPPAVMKAMGELVVARAVEHIASLHTQPILGDVEARDLCRTLREPAPDHGTPLEPLLDHLFRDLVPRSFNAAGPGYMAYIPGGGVYPAALADFIADTTNRFTGIWLAAPALVQLEANVLDWLRDWMEFPETTRGLLTTGGSMANFNAVVCARERHLGAEIRPGVLYASEQVHHSVMKSAKLAGVMPDRVRMVPVDADFRLRVDSLERAIVDRSAGGFGPVPGGVLRRHHEHRRGGPVERRERRLPPGEVVAPRRRRVRRVLPHVRGTAAAPVRTPARRFTHPRPAQGHVPAVRHGGPARS